MLISIDKTSNLPGINFSGDPSRNFLQNFTSEFDEKFVHRLGYLLVQFAGKIYYVKIIDDKKNIK